MATSLATQLLHGDHEVSCPVCEYPIWIMYAEIVAQNLVRCPCCRTGVWLRDADGSAQNVGDVIEQQIDQALKGLFR
jgi:hypothetical protein